MTKNQENKLTMYEAVQALLGVRAGKVAAKNQAEDELLNVLVPVASALLVHGGRQKQIDLREKANVSGSALRKMRDTELEGKIKAFSASIGQRESSVAGRVGARANLLELFDVADRTLTDELDRMMELLRGSQTQFYNEYFAARVIKDLGARHRAAPPASLLSEAVVVACVDTGGRRSPAVTGC